MNADTTKLVQQSWAKVVPIAPQAAALFYTNLFALDAGLKQLFKGDMEAQGNKLVQMISAAVGMLDSLDKLVPILQQLGARHAKYGVEASHYETVGKALLTTLSQGLGNDFTDQVKEAWVSVFGVMATVMIDAADAAAN